MAESMMAALGQPEHHQILRFGDVIILQEALSSNRGSFRGYVFSEISSSEYVAVASASPMETVGGFPITDWTMAAFKVVAPNKSVQQERYAEIKRHSRNYTAKHLQDAKRDAEVERKNNERLQEDLKGSVVVYDSVIQLLHMHSDKFLGVNTVQTSWTEESNMRISLFDHDSEKCSFKILPRYKLKSLEDQVMMGDAIMLASEKIKGLFLHTSNQKFEKWISVYKNLTCFEMNASAKNVSVFTILPHCSAVSDDRRLVKGGSIFQLYHHESQRYIVAEGSFANEPDECVTKQVHLRERKSKHGKLKDSSTSSITYWQIESDKDPTSGEVISWKDRCRIKHLPTKMYLAVVHEDNSSRVLVKLKHKEPDPNKSDVDIVFRLHSVTKDIAGIQFKSSAMIYHPYTKCWLGCVWGYSSRGDDELDAQELCIKSNAFTIEQLDAKLVNKFNHAAGFVPVIKSYLFSKLTSPNDISTRDTMFCKALKEMSIWVLNAHPTMKHHQKLLRNLMIPDMIVKVLQVYDPSSSVHERYADVFRTCYEVLEVYLKGKSSKNVHYLAMREDYMACFRNHAIDSKLYLHAGRTLLELIRDNEVILLSHNTKEIGGIIQSLVDSKYSFSFFYLSTLSVCDGRPLPRNQDIVTEMLVKQHGQELFYRYKVHETSDIHPSDKGPLRELQFSTSEHPRWRFLSDIFAASNNELKDNSAYWYLIGQLEVFSKICQENDAAIKVLDGEYITLEMAVCGLQDDKLHPMIRYMYAQIIIVMYVEKKRTVLEDRFPLFIYKDITKETSTKKQNISEVENVQFVLLKKWMLTYLSEHESIVTSDTDMNILTRGVLELLHLLIKHGYYAGINDVNVLMKPLLKLLDGKTDKPSNIETSFETDQKRFENNNENKFLFAVKVRALRIVDLLFSYQFHLRLQQFVCDYKQLRGAIDPNQKLEEQDEDLTLYKNLQDAGSTRPVKKAASKFALHEKQNVKAGFQLLVSKLGVNRDDMPGPPTALRLLWKCRASELQIHEHVWLMKLAVDRLEQILFYCCLDCDSQELSEILIDLSQYQNEELLCESLHLLGRIYSVEEELFENASQAQLLITSKSEKVFHMITTQLHPTLHHLTAVGAHDHEEQHQQLLSVLDQLISLCHMDGDQSEPDEQNQRILYNTGMFGNILSLLLATNATVSETDVFDNQQKKATISKCLQFLRLLARQNTKIREKLFKYVDSLLNVTIAIPEMASLLTEVLTEGHELCLKIKETQIEQLFKSIKVFYIDRDICPCSEVFELLQAMVKVKELNLPLKRNKDYMIKHFIQYYRSFPGHLLGLEEDNVSNRINALANDELQALMMLSIFDLLATLCEKDNLFMESTCQSVISISELLEMLSSDELQPLWKKPYACFLLWVYMNSGVEKTKSGSIILYHDGKMWSYLEQISDVLNGTVRALRCLKDDNEKRVVQQSLTSEFVKLSSSKDHLGSRITAKTTAVDIPHVTNKNGEIIPGLLVYIMEGVLPLLEVFYTDYFKPAESFASDSHDPMKEIRVTAAMASSLLNFADTIKTFLSSQTQWELLYTTTVTVLQHRDCNGFTLDIDPQVRERFDETRNKKVNCGVIIQLSAIEEQERALNRQFHTFVRNYELSYWGPNTAEYQIGSQFSTPYSDFEDDHLEKKGDEWLPLGKSFQRHVDLYITFDGANVSVKPCTKRIIDFLVLSYKQSPTLNEKARRRLENDNIRYLQLLRAIIHNQVMLVDPRLREEGENPVLYRQLCKPVEIVQCEIQSYDNAVKRIAKLLAHRSDNVFIEVLALLCMMLYNGNRDVREGFTYLMASREEEILSSMQERLQQATMNNHERRKLLFDLQTQSDSHRSLREYHDNHPAARDTSGQETEMISMQHDSGKVTGTARRKLVQAYEMTILSKMESASSPTSHDVTDSPTEMRIRQYTDIGDKADLLKFKDHSHIKLTLHLLGLLCDNQYSPMQDYLQQQPLSLKNINMVTETCDFLSTFIDDVSKDNIKLIIQVLQTLIEMSGGNFKNQKVLLDHHVVDTINHFLRIMDIETHGFKELCKLKEKAVELLEIICEETHSETDKLVQSLCRNIDIDALYDTLVWFYQCSQSAKVCRMLLITRLDYWTGTLDWTTGLTYFWFFHTS
ncbi:inositol 1,4,5-trisphosphate-gated calcium channel ITPR1-like isoform X2 [Dysidea avara]|uniref:inositol 1,4,5-trisphosphate-gated calcium channel ITPR1-like isoform X2 n=1 Tax=Dysidea avara TaxID=196820 RepID=UPI003326385A